MRLDVFFLAGSFNRLDEARVLLDGSIDTWEQVLDDVLEKWQIVFKELGHVNVSQCSEQQLVLIHLWIVILEQTSCIDD